MKLLLSSINLIIVQEFQQFLVHYTHFDDFKIKKKRKAGH